MQNAQNQFYTMQTMMTLAGATGATFVVANGLQRAFNFNPKWLALLIAQVVSLAGVIFARGSGSDYFDPRDCAESRTAAATSHCRHE